MQSVREKHENAKALTEIAPNGYLKHWLPWILAVLSGVLQVLIFPLPNWTFLCWVAIAPLLVALIRAGVVSSGNAVVAVRSGFLIGWISGIFFYAGSCYWVYHVMVLYGGLAGPVGAGVLLLFCLYV